MRLERYGHAPRPYANSNVLIVQATATGTRHQQVPCGNGGGLSQHAITTSPPGGGRRLTLQRIVTFTCSWVFVRSCGVSSVTPARVRWRASRTKGQPAQPPRVRYFAVDSVEQRGRTRARRGTSRKLGRLHAVHSRRSPALPDCTAGSHRALTPQPSFTGNIPLSPVSTLRPKPQYRPNTAPSAHHRLAPPSRVACWCRPLSPSIRAVLALPACAASLYRPLTPLLVPLPHAARSRARSVRFCRPRPLAPPAPTALSRRLLSPPARAVCSRRPLGPPARTVRVCSPLAQPSRAALSRG